MSKKDFAFGKENFIWLGISVALIVIGFLLMSGGGTEDGVTFNPEIFSKRRIVLAPLVALSGFILMIFAILKSSKNPEEGKEYRSGLTQTIFPGTIKSNDSKEENKK